MGILLRMLAAICGILMLASCGAMGGGSESGEVLEGGGSPQQVGRVKSGEMFDDDSDKMLGRYGAINPMNSNGGRGAADESSTVNNDFTGEFGKRGFNGKKYDRKAFWGKSDYAKQVYQGNTNGKGFNKGAKEGSQWASEGAQVSREAGIAHNRGRSFGGSASENSKSRLGRPTDAKVNSRRSSYIQPPVENVQRKRALTVDDTKSMLGR